MHIIDGREKHEEMVIVILECGHWRETTLCEASAVDNRPWLCNAYFSNVPHKISKVRYAIQVS